VVDGETVREEVSKFGGFGFFFGFGDEDLATGGVFSEKFPDNVVRNGLIVEFAGSLDGFFM